jgi:phosphonate transport system ATP-binding protein
MRLLCDICRERGLAAIINIHDVDLAKMFVQRIVGLRDGRIVFDGTPDQLGDDMLTEIYGKEDWAATRQGRDSGSMDTTVKESSDEHMAGLR